SPLPSSAVADDRVIVWSLKKRLGDEIGSLDANGNPMKLTLAASLRPSIFQGYVLLDKLVFKKLFGDADGIRALLVDCPKKKIAKIATALEHSLRNNGVVVEKCSARLARFRRVENTYLSIFLALGGLGLAVGGAGFGVLAARGAVERKLELELLDALGFPKRRIEMLLTLEGAIIVLCGTAAGIISASIAAIPAILNSTTPIPWSETLAIIAVVDITAILCLKTAAALSTLRV
ncbi:MAG: hypothetical protein KAG97_08855, partial [Victivallales bacterium]|nr:hypothetical protein [Victivallales bacterium]